MCGLAGYIGARSANMDKIRILMMNSSRRGTDGFGLYMNEKIFKQAEQWSPKISGDSFNILYGEYLTPTKSKHIILGHCRSKSVGASTIANTHPFEYVINDVRWIFAHNGTIKNIDQLATEYNVTRVVGETDSKTLGHILALGHWDVLTKYKGTAAFTLYNETEDILYIWRGVSKHDKNIIEDERPLHLFRGKDCIYWASEAENLASAMNSERNLFKFTGNALYSFQAGVQLDKVVYDRSEVVSYYEPVVTYRNEGSSSKINIDEPYVKSYTKGKPYYYNGLYYRNGHLVTGKFILNDQGKEVNKSELVAGNASEYYFYKGYLMRDFESFRLFNECKLRLDDFLPNRTYELAGKYTHPEMLLIRKYGSHTKHDYYFNGKYVHDGQVTPLFGKHTYVITRENPTKYICVIPNTTTVANMPSPTAISDDVSDREWHNVYGYE